MLYLHSSELILSHLQIQTTLTILRYFGIGNFYECVKHDPNMTQHTTFLIFYSIRLVPMILTQKIVFYPQVAQEMIQTQTLPLES